MLKLLVSSLLLLTAASGYAESAEDWGPLFSRLDADGDGLIVEREIPAEHVGLFARLLRTSDGDGDERLSLSEFNEGVTPNRPAKPLTEKAKTELPGSDALLLMLAWMDRDANLVITSKEVPPRLQPLFEQFLTVGNEQGRTAISVAQLKQQAIRYAGLSARFAAKLGIDVEVELALLSDAQWDYVQRLRTSLRPGSGMTTPESAAILFAELDTDGDGKISIDEVPESFAERMERLLARGDRDQDKQLSSQEFQSITRRLAAVESSRPSLTQTTQRVNQMLRRFDRNGDKRLSRVEVPSRLARRLDRLDENGDGQLDIDELTGTVENASALRNSAIGRLRPASPQ